MSVSLSLLYFVPSRFFTVYFQNKSINEYKNIHITDLVNWILLMKINWKKGWMWGLGACINFDNLIINPKKTKSWISS